MKKVLPGVALGIGAVLAAHAAPGPAPLSVTKAQSLGAPPAQVWRVIGNFGDLTWVSSIVKASRATNGNTPGSVRTLNLGAATLTERLTAYDADAMTYSYVIEDTPANRKVVPVSHYLSTISVAPGPHAGAVVTWHGTFNRLDTGPNPPATADDAAAVKAISGIYATGLADLAKKLGG